MPAKGRLTLGILLPNAHGRTIIRRTSPPALANGDTLTVWANGFSATGKIRNKAKESHDGNGEFTLVLETPIPVAAKSRTFFVQNDRVIGIGIAKDVLR